MNIKRLLRKIDLYNWIRYRTWNRYHILKMRYLKPGWHDEDELLIHSMFEVLSQFIEGEDKYKIVNWDSNPQHKQAWKEMNELHKWWIKRQKRESDNPILQPNIKSPSMKFTPTEKKWINPETKKEEGTSRMDFVYKSKKDKARWKKACKDCTKWEEKCFNEDTEMMIRLIKIRPFMWT